MQKPGLSPDVLLLAALGSVVALVWFAVGLLVGWLVFA